MGRTEARTHHRRMARGGSSLGLLALGLAVGFLSSACAESPVNPGANSAATENSTSPATLQEQTLGVTFGVKNSSVGRLEVGAETVRGKDARWNAESRILAPSSLPWKGSKGSHRRDSYLEALRHSRTNEDPRAGSPKSDAKQGKVPRVNRREYSPGPVYSPQTEYGSPKEPERTYLPGHSSGSAKPSPYDDYSRDAYSFEPSESYSLPTRTSVSFKEHGAKGGYDAPRISYGPPKGYHQQNPYGDYHPGPYAPQQGYGGPTVSYGVPHGISEVSHQIQLPSFDFSWPLALKLNAFTLAKILLKLVIFKMIVKFIAVICLLLFIPKLEIIKKKGNKGDMEEDEDEGRRFLSGESASSGRLNTLTSIVMNSYEKYEALNSTPRSSSTRNSTRNSTEDCALGCRLRKALSYGESWQDYQGLFRTFALQETGS